jgi:glycosyltransferase involved in cell wall biosynthesis
LSNGLVKVHSDPSSPPEWRAQPWDGDSELCIAVLGAIGVEKGSEVLLRCAQDAHSRKLPLRFAIIGYTNNDAAFRELPNVTLTGRYEERDLTSLLRRLQPHISFFPAVWPETFSYTLTIAFRCGLFPVAFNLGAIGERIGRTGFGRVMPLDLHRRPGDVNEILLEAGREAATASTVTEEPVVYPSMLGDYYELPLGRT